jgi:hypothetical protein
MAEGKAQAGAGQGQEPGAAVCRVPCALVQVGGWWLVLVLVLVLVFGAIWCWIGRIAHRTLRMPRTPHRGAGGGGGGGLNRGGTAFTYYLDSGLPNPNHQH